jgi:asparagine synthase (glutamine-hydrolysing)
MLLTFFRRCPQALRGVIAKSLSLALSTGKPVDALQAILPKSFRWTRLSDKLERLVSILGIQSSSQHYRILASIGGSVDRLVIGSSDLPQSTEDETWPADTDSIVERMMHLDFASYLVDDILVKVDRASMSVGLEVRSPFLDREFVEWAWHLPMRAKIRGGRGKWISYQLANRLIPGGFLTQPKMGFAVPLASWLRGDLRDWAEDLLDARRLSREGFLDPQETRRRWDAFVKGRNDERHLIWALLMFQSWLAKSRS